jgi:hypothetical protein
VEKRDGGSARGGECEAEDDWCAAGDVVVRSSSKPLERHDSVSLDSLRD